ncbi:NUDIX domain-containing protein [Pseudomonas parafulva]|uniref:NUDIX domain-containing protein n=1 Tax=Pseudomonas parafulva TaxID=157782 RepID=A0AAI8PBR7_9PSED|nr:NUDIX domain-containing protein [Pseudomonas parafulva]AIZ33126.1 hypothetical protein NJ69_09105 [Pseudomonas parafulva]AXO88740.1 NUDIX domain-containing protein [Pseudomonas parafulva]
MPHANLPEKYRATVICFHEGQVLLVRKKGGRWNFPGGTVERGESPRVAAARELYEETGLSGKELLQLCSLEIAGVCHYLFTTHLYPGDKPAARSEIAACTWVARKALQRASLNPTAQALLASGIPALSPWAA